MQDQPPIALTMGEPAGIAGEITLKAWRELAPAGPPFFLLGDAAHLARQAALLGIAAPIRVIADPAAAAGVFRHALPVMSIGAGIDATPGRPSPSTAPMVIGSIARAVELARAGHAAAIATNPIQKSALTAAGFTFPGHTEYLAHLGGVERAVMMLAGPDLRVAPITVHVPLRMVPDLLTEALVIETAVITEAALRGQFGIARPRLVIAGLNPHAGEDGTIGFEDRDVLAPAVAKLRTMGLDVTGPHPADTLFHAVARRRYDAALCPTHDQALIPLKTLAFDEGVNVTLGLPFVRTSPDHGTALDIAGAGAARPDSLIAAIRMAADLGGRASRG